MTTSKTPELAFATPRKLPRPQELRGRIVVLDVAFASEASGGGFEKLAKPFIEGLGNRLALWIDHHDHVLHAHYAKDPRFVLATKAEHGACPEMVTAELVARAGEVDTVVCHTDFDGLCSAAKWIAGGKSPTPARMTTRAPSTPASGLPARWRNASTGQFEESLRDYALLGLIIRHLASGLRDAALWVPIDEAAGKLAALETEARRVADHYKKLTLSSRESSMKTAAFVDATTSHGRYDKTLLLLAGQERASIAIVLDRDTISFAAPFNSGVNFLSLLGLSGGMPTLVSIPKTEMANALAKIGVSASDVAQLA